MADGDIGRNFQPFHGSFSSGTGLGLAIVYRIVQEHQGRIRIKSRREAGTEVQILLPKTPVASPPVAQGETWIGY
jgi:signal transduction histidine kinase